MIILRYDGKYDWIEGDARVWTIRNHFMGVDGRDYYGTTWTGAAVILKLFRTGKVQ